MMLRVEKLMSVSRAEFVESWRAFDASPPPGPGEPVCLPVGTGRVTIAYEPRPGVRLGGLLELPRALVTLTFEAADPPAAAALVARFDRAFQRGGG
jgi:hypothetical protein